MNPARFYFFLSYAHSAPLQDGVQTDTDHWVSVFFKDLSAEVRRRAHAAGQPAKGFFDDLVEPGADWKAALSSILGAADVFVPLYSPGYFNKSWPMRERASFLQRLTHAAPAEPTRHIVPVLWIPLPAWDRIPERAAALDLGHGVPAYAENGLRALCMLASYRKQYLIILRRLAQRIVEVAQTTPLPPSPALTINDIAATPPTETQSTPFVVGVLAPTRASLPPHRSTTGYGVTPRSWRPYAEAQELPIAEYAANVAERLGLPTRIVDTSDDLGYLDNSPGVLLIDPWVAAGQDGTGALSVVSAHLHPWVTPLLVADQRDPQYAESGAALDGEVTDKLHEIGAYRIRQSLKAEQFVQLMPSVVSEARRQYLKHAPVFLPKGPQQNRPRITGDDTSMPFTREEFR